MIVYLAGDVYNDTIFPAVDFKFNRLDSFYYVEKNRAAAQYITKYNRYILDSGAFTYMMNKSGKKLPDIDSFTDRYIEFVKEHRCANYFEMDVDSVFGYDKVKALRARIESKVGWPCIPVFHMNRGLEDWKAMCNDYPYIAIGVAGKDFAWGDTEAFANLVASARSFGCKVHGLGVTGMKSLEAVPFYSVDSSAWTCGNRYKAIYQFDGKHLKAVKANEIKGKRIINHEALALHNLKEWVAFADSMEGKQVIKA